MTWSGAERFATRWVPFVPAQAGKAQGRRDDGKSRGDSNNSRFLTRPECGRFGMTWSGTERFATRWIPFVPAQAGKAQGRRDDSKSRGDSNNNRFLTRPECGRFGMTWSGAERLERTQRAAATGEGVELFDFAKGAKLCATTARLPA